MNHPRDNFLLIAIFAALPPSLYWTLGRTARKAVVQVLVYLWAAALGTAAFALFPSGAWRDTTLTASLATVAQYWFYLLLESQFERRFGRPPVNTFTQPRTGYGMPDVILTGVLASIMVAVVALIFYVGKHSG